MTVCFAAYWKINDRKALAKVMSGDTIVLGRTLATGGDDHSVRLWRDGAELMSLAGARIDVYDLAFSPDGRTLASGSDDRTVRLWDVRDPRHVTEIATLSGAAIAVADITFSPDGRTLAWTMFDPTMRLLNADLGAAVAEACGSAGPRLTEDQWRRHVPDVPYSPPC